MPDWSNADSIQRYLKNMRAKDAYDQKWSNAQRQEQKRVADGAPRPTTQMPNRPRILDPLVTGQPVRRRQEQKERPARDRQNEISSSFTPMAGNTWRPGEQPPEVQRAGMFGLSMPQGDLMDWVGLGNHPAAQYADWQHRQDVTDAQGENFPGQDALQNFFYQWDAVGRAAATTPFIPYQAQKNDPYGLEEGKQYTYSLSEALAPAGQMLNRTLNPFNPNKNPGAFGEEYDKARKEAGQSMQYRADINALPPDQREVAWRVFTSNAYSNNVPQVFDDVINRGQKAADAYRQMQTAQAAGDDVAAARYGQQWNYYNDLSEREIIEQNQNPWAEIVFGTVVDPVDWATGAAGQLLGLTPRLAKAAQAARAFNLDPITSGQNIDAMVAKSAPLVEKILAGQDIRSFWQNVNPVERTRQAQAYLAARTLTETALTLMTNVQSKVDAQGIMDSWIKTGGRNLITDGIKLATPGDTTFTDTLRVGAGVMGNTGTVKAYPILAAASDPLAKMKSLTGEGPFKASEFIPEFAKVIEATARQAYKVKPMGTLAKVVNWPSQFLRAVLVDQYLNLRPANWWRQALSQTANALADETYSLRPLSQIVGDVMKKNDGLALDTRFRSKEMFSESGQAAGNHWTTMLGLPKNNPLAKMSEAGASMWTGDKTIGGRAPLGENSFYDSIYGTTFLRSFNDFWKDAVAQQFLPAVAQMGLDDQFTRTLANIAVETGKSGGKTDLVKALRKTLGSATIKDTTALKIPDELLPLELRGALNNIIQGHTPDQVEQAFGQIQGVLAKARRYKEEVIEGGPPSWKPEFTRNTQIDDATRIVQNFQQLARKSGLPAKEAGDAGRKLALDILRAEDGGYKAFLEDLAQTQADGAMNFAFDVWEEVYNLKTATRQKVDEINLAAVKAANVARTNMDQRTGIWGEAYQKTAQAWQDYAGNFGSIMERARQTILEAEAGTPLPTSSHWQKTLERYFAYDEAAVAQARALEPGATWDEGPFRQVIDGSRQYVDHAATELFDILRRFPTTDSLDIVATVFRQADAMGAQISGMVRRATEEAKATKDWDGFIAYRNEKWRELAQDSVEAFNGAKRGIVWNWLVEQTPSRLRWTDEFAGDFQLVGPLENKPGVWLVRDGSGKLVRLAEEGLTPGVKETGELRLTPPPRTVGATEAARAPSGGNGIYVPKTIIDDYRKLVEGDIEEAVDEILDEVSPLPERGPMPEPETPTEVGPKPQSPITRPSPVRSTGEPGWETRQTWTPGRPRPLDVAPAVDELPPPATLQDVYKAASGVGIGTDKTTRWLLNSIRKHADEMGITAPNRLEDLTPDDLARVRAYYEDPDVISSYKQPKGKAQQQTPVASTATQAARTGARTQAWIDPNKPYDFEYDVVELDDLIASNDELGRVNPNYPSEYQPRDRSSAASMTQVQQMAGRLSPDELLGETQAIERGTPIVSGSNIVLSGNGRTMAMRLTTPDQYKKYAEALTQRAAQVGIDAARLAQMRMPVLVRRLVGDVDPVAFAQEANQRSTLGMNALETAKQLSAKILAADFEGFDMARSDNLRSALSLVSSQDFVRNILKRLPANERGALIDQAGNITTQGIDTIRATLFNIVFPDNPAVLQNYILAPRADLANVGLGIERVINRLAKLAKQNPDLAIGGELSEAAMTLKQAREAGQPVATFLNQGGLFGETPEAVKMLTEFLGQNIRSGRNIAAVLGRYADEALKHMPDQVGMFDESPDKLKMLQAAIDWARSAPTGGLFDGMQEMQGGLGAVRAWPDWMVAKPFRRGLWKPTGNVASFFPEGDAYESIKHGIQQARLARGAAPEVGDAALNDLRTIDQLETFLQTNLASILSGTPNTLTPAMRLQLLDVANKTLLPAWDNVIRAASESGRRMGEFAMMDFNDRRNVDVALAVMMPFHYYWSRSAKNWLQRVATKPHLLDFYLESERGVYLENQQVEEVDGQIIGRPQRLEGTVPNPLKEVVDQPWMPDRLGNPTRWMWPFAMYTPSAFEAEVDDEDTQSQIVNSTLTYLAEKAFPWNQAIVYGWLDENVPVAEGQKPRMQQWLEAQQIADYFPATRVAGYAAQAAGQRGLPANGFMSTGTEWDPYFAGRTTRNETAMGNIDRETAQYAQQMMANHQQGQDPFYLIPADKQQAAQAAYNQMVQETGVERLAREAGTFFTGLTSQFYPEGEKINRAASQAYAGAGYNGGANPGGSKAAKDQILKDSPSLVVGWGNAALVPGATGERPPGASAQISAGFDEGARLRAEMKAEADAAVDAAIMANPNIRNAEITAVRNEVEAKWQPQIDAAYDTANQLGLQYPIPSSGAPKPDPRNPAEQRADQVEAVYDAAWDLPGRPASDAPQAVRNQWYAERDQSVIDDLVQMGYSPAEAAAMWEERQTRNQTELERQTRGQNQAYAEMTSEQWALRSSTVADTFGPDAVNVWSTYLSLPKGDARAEYKAKHPELNAYNLAVYEQDAYKILTEMYGEDGIMAWAMTPTWTENPDDQKRRTAYLDANPKAWMVDAWIDGRPEPYDPNSSDMTRNKGADWSEAERLFGPDIWGKVEAYRSATGKERSTLRDQLGLKPWLDWWYDLLPDKERSSSLPPASVFRGGGQGRTYGGGSYGGGGGGGYGGGYGSDKPWIPYIDPAQMDRDLEVTEGDIRPWRAAVRPGDMPDWIYAGDRLKPTRRSWR